jgi:CBS domain-containing protein
LTGSSDSAEATFLDTGAKVTPAEAVLGYLAFINTLLLAFNLIPGFPLDGGRIARAIAWWRTGDRLKATRFAAVLGRGFGYLLAGFGVFLVLQGNLIGGIWLVFIGMFLGQAARSAEFQTAISERIEGLRVADVMDPEPVALPAATTLDRALDEYFLRYRWPWFPVTDHLGRFIGFVTREQIEHVPEGLRHESTVDEVVDRDPGSVLSVRLDEPLESLLASEGLRQLGALMAVDAEGVLRGVVTLDQVRRALRPAAAPSA